LSRNFQTIARDFDNMIYLKFLATDVAAISGVTCTIEKGLYLQISHKVFVDHHAASCWL
jgi:hypothetical protein